MQIKTTMRYHLTPVRLAIINKSTTSAGEDVEKKEHLCTAGGNADWCIWKTIWSFLKKLKMELPFDPVIPLLGIYPRKPETPIRKDICTHMFIAAQFTIAKIWKQPKCPSVDEWIRKLWYIYTMEYYAAVKRKELLPFATAWMELESIMLSEISQSMREKYHMISLIHG
uniref:DUF1725 domain-containing protein n=1 Tax=Myotis myotis TaxID=51298 RepID=A0A7J7TTX4_MYOMY|nr:hypothetical protein mMyoMyo1_009010 [Myotis myotis]